MIIHALSDSFEIEISDIAADKSISHRFAIFSLLTNKENKAKNYLLAKDTLHTLEILKQLGAEVKIYGTNVSIIPPKKIVPPKDVLYCGNSGTLMRLMIGFLSGISGFFVLSGDSSLNNRPMKRVCDPLKSIGAKIYGRENANLAPICIEGQKLHFFNYESQISSAQVKTAMILSALNTNGKSIFKELNLSRNHSENMLKAMGAPLKISENGLKIEISNLKKPLIEQDLEIPNDPSSAFYFILAALITPNSKIRINNILLNSTRIEAYKVLQKMGAKIEIKITQNHFESIGEIRASFSKLKAVEVKENIAWLIDEIPALAIAFALADGISILKNAKELRVKESDRICSIVSNLKLCGIKVEEFEDGFKIEGGKVNKAKIKSYNDHRIAMSFAILGMVCGMEIDDFDCIKTSFPNFIEILKRLGVKIDY
ncbi:3-phosphoshikimate 1-carboxyvinyltransferase [Campylobacter sp. LH-2024]|uniref:3-phosphoshikimate 1-carboxyvinyltransferase n=1 Tax=Campylobacter molothri TaxID=1032242 RepID=A0ACC5W106_9BACT|nr:3-phosphoshikimate 1-carboxyvinyltransferase [Campylobacter sp. W0065]MBZ7940786.1 3-phosphoshikimate 1-carboxyvinyltransferase [Campylobacter sp. W0047]MBZ7946458.1 3-phosphoshikimate 1-carboxyvinyltransferase [Campylobacter sp. RM10536]MBZ7950345.1 3-phosphoshikimate 1-carboxyvinyltransferase [Campylobacter sp. W0046]MBZ7951806.1 3-phosphoshikimate 1-carboxyvinyltransferase [Campylobacter sp. RM9939]MBZ7956217.1 3-phosphoshikimate 1-carboxyvinyltransferase [Campylobacter sp. RM10541]MBZ7